MKGAAGRRFDLLIASSKLAVCGVQVSDFLQKQLGKRRKEAIAGQALKRKSVLGVSSASP